MVCQIGHRYGMSDGVGETSRTRPINSSNGSVAAKTSRRRNASIPEVIASPSHDPVPPVSPGTGAGVGGWAGSAATIRVTTTAVMATTVIARPPCAARPGPAARG